MRLWRLGLAAVLALGACRERAASNAPAPRAQAGSGDTGSVRADAAPVEAGPDAGLASTGSDETTADGGGAATRRPASDIVEQRPRGALLRAIAAAGWALVFTSERSGRPQVHLLDGDTERALTFDAAHHLQDVALEHGEALLSRVEGSSEQVVAVSLLDGGVRGLTPGLDKAHAAVLSPDEVLVAFESSLAGASDVAIVPFDASAPPRLVAAEATGSFQPAFTRAGRALILTSSATGDPELYRQPLDGGARQRLTAFHLEDFGAAPSPDGARLAFVSNREGADRVFVQGLDGRGVQRLSSTASEAADVESDPVWMPDGRSVLVTVRRGPRVLIERIEVGTRKVRWTSSGGDQLPRPSPDGRFIAFVSDREGSADVFVMRADGTGVTRATMHGAPEYGPRWTRRAAPR
ncbi:MAG: PD40 domain-containing protein [Myxococcaceae bacterium]|nr:PD40 domain-containing protein [Myxococcaceae bacterium]